MRLVPQGTGGQAEGIQAILFVPPADGKRVQPGMAVQVVTSHRAGGAGRIHPGEVVHVSETPATREAVQQTIRNAAFRRYADGQRPAVRGARGAQAQIRPPPAGSTGLRTSAASAPWKAAR